MLLKDRVLLTIKEQLPDEFTMDALFERMSFIENIEQGLKDSEEGRTITETELDKEMTEWFK
jgi:predicted transcriptional regulator